MGSLYQYGISLFQNTGKLRYHFIPVFKIVYFRFVLLIPAALYGHFIHIF